LHMLIGPFQEHTHTLATQHLNHSRINKNNFNGILHPSKGQHGHPK